MKRLFLIVLFCVFSVPTYGQVQLLRSDPHKAVWATYAYILQNSLRRIDVATCGEPIRRAIGKVLASKDDPFTLVEQNFILQTRGCFDHYSQFVLFRRTPNPPQENTSGGTTKLAYRTVIGAPLTETTQYVLIERFGSMTARDFARELSSTRGMRNLVLDLRDNPGGSLDGALSIAHLFARSEKLVLAEYVFKNGDVKTLVTTSAGIFRHVRIIMLVNRNTASAGEALAGAIRCSAGDARILGERTYGKGVFQNALVLDEGIGLYLTAGEYFVAGDRVRGKIQGIGLLPDVLLPNTRPTEVDRDVAVKMALTLLEK